MKIIDDNEQTINVMNRYITHANIPPQAEEYTFINANLCEKPNDKRTDAKGILLAQNHLKEGEKIAIYSFLSAQFLYSEANSTNKEFMKTMSLDSSLFLRLPDLASELIAELNEPKYYNPAMSLASTAAISSNIAGSLLHSIQRTGEAETAALGRSKLGIEGTDNQVLEQLYKLKDYGNRIITSNELIKGLFVDVENTILTQDNNINEQVLEKMIQYKGPVTLWTGGELKKIQKTLGQKFEEACIKQNSRLYTRTPILSKYTFNQCFVEEVIDDSSQDEFKEVYKIKSEKYTQID
ncbi:hypothetical protein COV13_02825 [Candidatus Woesearchaeota archaeon CG10_big_fil_rev_8_21_14_0_10_32_9]|nr:MAG: hypothetical protein COV13_02825 [Candidatus Woesearchaeota archaeon CG10_big_fil_rev_8_21_14_0_10_32_9]